MKRCLCLLFLLLSLSCEKTAAEKEPQTPQAMYEHAQALLHPNVKGDSSDFEGALLWTRRAAEGGYLQAQRDLGGLYLSGGKGVKPDAAEAYRWFSAAAQQGDLASEVFVGMLLYDGYGVARDRAAAQAHWRRAAEGGIAEAQWRLGRVLAAEPATEAEGVVWLKKAVREGERGGIPQAATALGNIYYKGGASLPADEQEARHWYAVGAGGGDPLAQHVYACLLLSGEAADEPRGLGMLRMAAGQNHLPAMQLLIRYLRQKPELQSAEGEAEAWAKRLNELKDPPQTDKK